MDLHQRRDNTIPQKMVYDIQGKVCLVTGSAQGIGKSLAQILLENRAKVCLSDVDGAMCHKTLKEFSKSFSKSNVTFVS